MVIWVTTAKGVLSSILVWEQVNVSVNHYVDNVLGEVLQTNAFVFYSGKADKVFIRIDPK